MSNEAAPLDHPPTTNYVELAGCQVPLTVSSHADDYYALRRSAGCVDLTMTGVLSISGPSAEEALNQNLTRDITYLTPDRSQTALILEDDGKPIDLLTIFRTPDALLLQTSIGRTERVLEVLGQRITDPAVLIQLSTSLVPVAVEGPDAPAVVNELLEEPIDGLPYQGARWTTWQGDSVLVSRTGVTSEFGYTLYTAKADQLWRQVTSLAPPVGLAALETTMLEVRQPLMYKEILADDTVVSAGLNWLVELDKDFPGCEATVKARLDATTRRVSLVCDGEVSAGDDIRLDGEVVGDVVVAAFSPTLDAYCGVGRMEASFAVAGLSLEIGDIKGRTASSPVVIPTSWGVRAAG